ncbi:hypothetical protein FB567DRAFT_550258 [Paraphoma chrysanthemicola]|uniref:Uncharacterized protein n=1 Tax=Paraphoma chrysanthemicola TaxID=798071 RepID=A0A8K0R560_9PLEO|nr:hypothetical protein FB567DRAFT_550258 [Paraphoma chrysanthemicola]
MLCGHGCCRANRRPPCSPLLGSRRSSKYPAISLRSLALAAWENHSGAFSDHKPSSEVSSIGVLVGGRLCSYALFPSMGERLQRLDSAAMSPRRLKGTTAVAGQHHLTPQEAIIRTHLASSRVRGGEAMIGRQGVARCKAYEAPLCSLHLNAASGLSPATPLSHPPFERRPLAYAPTHAVLVPRRHPPNCRLSLPRDRNWMRTS